MIPGSANPLLLASAAAAGGYQIERSVRLNAPDSAYFSRTPSSAGNRKTWTWAGWVKRSGLGNDEQVLFSAQSGTTSWRDMVEFTNGKLIFVCTNSTPVITLNLQTTAVYRDPGAWMHVVIAVDTTQGTAANRAKIYVNGGEVTAFSLTSYPSQNTDFSYNDTRPHAIGQAASGIGWNLNGYLADIHFIDGQALTPSSFGEFDTNGVWQPKAYTGSYGTNGFHLDFADNSANTATTLGKDTSGNGNNWTPNNLSVTAGAGNDSLVDVPTNGTKTDTGAGGEVRGNYATLNPLFVNAGAATLSNGNLDYTTSSGSYATRVSSIGVSSGKWYAEFTFTVVSGGQLIGIANNPSQTIGFIGDNSTSFSYAQDAKKYTNGSGSSYGASFTNGDIIGIAFDADAGSLVFYKNGSSQGTAFSSIATGTYFFGISGNNGTTGSWNFGQRPFAYTAPSGFKALCTANLPTPTIANGATAFDVALDTGANILTAAQNKLLAGTDLIWIKDRANSNNHQLIDTVRGGTATLQSNTTAAETTYSAPSGSSVAWCWDAGSSTVTNTQGSITSQVRANASAGFSVVTFTGANANATVGHGLGIAPALVILKNRTVNGIYSGWAVFHLSTTAGGFLQLNTADAYSANTTTWNNTSPTASVVSVGSFTGTSNYVAYCFAPVAGYTAASSYTGNGSADGPFVFTNMRPRWILIKRTDTTSNWTIIDTAREGYNVDNDPLFPNLANAEGTTDLADILSNGFKLRTTDASVNASAGTYIYFAIAEAAFNYSRAR